MYHSKKIGVFISHIMGYYQKNVCQGIIDTSLEYGYTAEIFATLDGENLGDYGLGEKSILNIPDFADYDGIIFASDSYPAAEFKDAILSSLREKCSCPVIEIAARDHHFPTIALENNRMTADLVGHLIRVHGCQRICYLGCSTQADFSDLRANWYRQTMEEHGLSIGNRDIVSCTPEAAEVEEALDFLFSAADLPDAIVCYNDEMALLAMSAVTKRGLHIPEDIAITGCDCSPDGQYAVPALTTVTFPVYELGQCSVETLIRQMQGESVPDVTEVIAHPVYAASCGCKLSAVPDHLSFQQSLNRRIASLESSILSSMRMSAAFSRITDLFDGMDLLENYVRKIEHCKEFYLCLYSGWDTLPNEIGLLTMQDDASADPDEVLLALAMRDGKRLPECTFSRKAAGGLLPEQIYKKSDFAYLYTPLFFEDREFGYIALSYEENRIDYHFQLVHWFLNVNQMLHAICETRCTSLLVQQLENASYHDALTGLYNRKGFLKSAEMLFSDASEGTTACFLFKLNGLYNINTTFGHAEGDFAIRVIGQALASVARPGNICARFSNLFCLLAKDYTKKDADDLLAHVEKYLNHYNRLSAKDYEISATGGYTISAIPSVFSEAAAEELLRTADAALNAKNCRYFP